MSEKEPETLMFVRNVVNGNGIATLCMYEVGDGCTAVNITMTLPPEVARALLGRSAIVSGGWGSICKIKRWLDLPTT